MEHKKSAAKGTKTIITTSLAGLLAYWALPIFGYSNDPLDPLAYASATAFIAGSIKYLRDLTNQFLDQTGWDITL